MRAFGLGEAEAAELIDHLSLASKDHLTMPSPHPFAHVIHSFIAIFVCYFVFDWWGVSTAIQIRLNCSGFCMVLYGLSC